MSLFAGGTVAGGLILGAWGGFKRKIVTAQIGLILSGLCTVVIGVVPRGMFLPALIGNTLVGALLPIINGSFGATLQATITPEMQGRVFAFIRSAAMLVSPLALIVAGPFADAFGIQIWFLVAGISCTVMGIAGLLTKEIMQMENHKTEAVQHVVPEQT
jgi:DHA3 family macrolide efflux protein-like MFS transporter